MPAFYNDNDRFAAAWLRELVAAGHLPAGAIDERSISDIEPSDLAGYSECHFFAGIGGWPYALRLAGWQGEVWTGSCPCQPLSSAGQRKGHADSRHLWPTFYRLIAECRPATVFGEQVASRLGREWLAGVRADLEALGYAVGAADLCAASIGAPHIRQRLFWVADAGRGERQQECCETCGRQPDAEWCGTFGGLGLANRPGSQPGQQAAAPLGHGHPVVPASDVCGMGDAPDGGCGEERALARAGGEGDRAEGAAERFGSDHLASAEWLICRDGKARRVEPGICPLADGVSARVGRLRGYGNAIVPQVAAAFVRAFMEARLIRRGNAA